MSVLDLLNEYTIITDEVPEGTIIDGQKIAALYHKTRCIGYSALSIGLDDYYLDQYNQDLKDKVRGEFIITQMQKFKQIKSNTNLNYKNILTRYWLNHLKEQNIEKVYMISADKLVWEIPQIKKQLQEHHLPLPKWNILLQNYDYTAKRNKFKRDEETGLFLKYLK